MITDAELKSLAFGQLEWARKTRRELHKCPEQGFHEYKTLEIIREKLAESGIDYEDGNGWITAVICGAQDGVTTAFRADFDGLPVTEPQGAPFRSENEGWMHACGHDMHTAMLLATARLLNAERGRLSGKVKLLFQPAEESVGGAKPMADAGVMDDPKVDRVYGLHVMPRLLTGQAECRAGTLNASTDTVLIDVFGTGSHGAYPESGADAIVCASAIVGALQTLVSRNVSPLESAVLTIGKIEGGRASNIICDHVKMEGTLRTANAELRSKLITRISEVAAGVSAGMGCSAEAVVKEGYAALVNDQYHCNRVLETAGRLLGRENALVKDAPSMGGEDFSYFLEKAKGAFFHLGCSRDPQNMCAPLHSELFAPDEECMKYGILLLSALAL